jgi:hypothetical protein
MVLNLAVGKYLLKGKLKGIADIMKEGCHTPVFQKGMGQPVVITAPFRSFRA